MGFWNQYKAVYLESNHITNTHAEEVAAHRSLTRPRYLIRCCPHRSDPGVLGRNTRRGNQCVASEGIVPENRQNVTFQFRPLRMP